MLVPNPVAATPDIFALVKQAPEFLGMDGAGPAVRVAVHLAGSEAAGAVALVAIDDAGGLSLVGCPLRNEGEAYTVVVRELLGLHGRLWRMGYDAFRSMVDKALGRPLVKLMAEKAGAGFAEPAFQAGVVRALEQGGFTVIILLNDVGSESTEAVSYLKSMGVNVKLFGVELLESWGVEIALPRLLSAGEPVPDAGLQARTVARPTPPSRPTQRTGGLAPASVANFGGTPAAKPAEESKSTVWPQGEPPRRAQPTRPAAAEPKPTPQPATAQIDRVWDGTKPGVMSGKRPPPKAPEGRR